MSAIINFDVRNFSTHISYNLMKNRNKLFKLIIDIFDCLDKAIKQSRTIIANKSTTFVNHTGDGFVAICYGKGKSLQSLIVSSLIANDVKILIDDYNHKNAIELLNISPLDYGIGIHKGKIGRFEYHPEYPGDNLMVAFLGHAINVSNRVQESTKDHTFNIICSKKIYDEAISVIKDSHRETVKQKFFRELGNHKLRGIKYPVGLYGVKLHLAENIEPNMLNYFERRKPKTEK